MLMALQRSPVGASRVLFALFMLLPALMVQGERIAGGLQPADVSDSWVQQAANFAMEKYNEASNDLYYGRMVRILKADSQVVEGMKYYLTVEVVNTLCEKKGGEKLDLDGCALPPENEQKKQICEFQVWFIPWLKKTELLGMKCQPA